jgi:hypothetical protein
MTDTKYGPSPIKCRECGAELETIEKGHLQSQNCTREVEDVEDYRAKYPDAPTRSIEMRDKIIDNLRSD